MTLVTPSVYTVWGEVTVRRKGGREEGRKEGWWRRGVGREGSLCLCVYVSSVWVGVVVVVVVVVVSRTCVSVHTHADVQLIQNGPMHWSLRLDCPAGTPTPVAYGSRFQAFAETKATNPKARKKIARHAQPCPNDCSVRRCAILARCTTVKVRHDSE